MQGLNRSPASETFIVSRVRNMRQKPRDKDSNYFNAQEDYDTLLKQFFAQKYESELRPALLNESHRWRKEPERLKARR